MYLNEEGYISLMKDLIANGSRRDNRTGVDTISSFGHSIRFNITDSFPLLTTKKVYWKGVMEELIWFINGDTSARRLNEKSVKIWNGNTSREFLDSRNLAYEDGDCGPVYGFQWRHWNAKYTNCDGNYTDKGIDQLAGVIKSIKNDPMSRRHIISAWNVEQLEEMALPPCHMLCQFYVSKEGGLSCQMYQRSADVFLGLPFNIASYSALTYLIAKETGLVPETLTICIGDAHIYMNHLTAVKQQIENIPKPFPTLKLNHASLDALSSRDFTLLDYNHCGIIKAEMVI